MLLNHIFHKDTSQEPYLLFFIQRSDEHNVDLLLALQKHLNDNISHIQQIFRIIFNDFACRKISFNSVTAKTLESMISFNTFPVPPDGN